MSHRIQAAGDRPRFAWGGCFFAREVRKRSENLHSILESGALRLGDPENWQDKNDAASVAAFRRKTGAAKVRVLCFATGLEQIHHWNTYARDTEGCCIAFDDLIFPASFDGLGLLHSPVLYRPLGDLTAADLRNLPVRDLPFIKRRPYECEQEYRVVWSGAANDTPPEIPLPASINSVTLSPYIPDSKRGKIKSNLETDCRIKRVQFSRLLEDPGLLSKFANL